MTKTYRPGVYSQYDIISQRRSLQDRYAFYCGAAKVREGKSIPAGGVVQIHSRQELEEYFDAQGGALFCAVCGILLDSGVSGVYAVPLTIDGTAAAENLYEPAIQKLCEVKRSGVILCDSQAQTVLQKMVEQVQLASQNERERLAVGGVAKAQAQQIAKALNCERLVLCCQAGSDGETESSVILTAAALAAMLVGSEPMDNLHGKVLESLTVIDPLEEQEVESLLGSGVTVLESLDGAVSCIRCVTSRTLTGGEEDRTFASVNTVMMIDDIIRSVRERLSGLLKGSTILFSQDSVASQAAVVLDQKHLLRAAGGLCAAGRPVGVRGGAGVLFSFGLQPDLSDRTHLDLKKRREKEWRYYPSRPARTSPSRSTARRWPPRRATGCSRRGKAGTSRRLAAVNRWAL